ncbi:MAG: HNH endonuclease [Chromatiales bacterium]
MSEAFDIYERYRKGVIARFPHRFWAPPEGFARVIEIVRKVSAEEGLHPSDLTVARIKAWGLYSPFINLFESKLSKLRELASAGVPAPDSTRPSSGSIGNRPRLTNAVMSEVWTRDGGKCVDCGSIEDLEFDHVIPFSKGGSSTTDNLRILCRVCNRKRGATL